jgi:hypothetical protein
LDGRTATLTGRKTHDERRNDNRQGMGMGMDMDMGASYALAFSASWQFCAFSQASIAFLLFPSFSSIFAISNFAHA